ncbi:Ig-like domain-containing protein [Rhodoferax sp. TBRC 17660]|uniref:Ig-like domain-containing protein n=1 Tax=Rhodoferax potami TaxID=3068338 RepID=A0ABU3KSL5_9BURK|nr:Ig-like domain-containing protein [Rhodoferax sp. TBRC 17660]MDT7520759.1 Ig-like domain-containing protein [Rhodoferax sp. TBRC 17660]
MIGGGAGNSGTAPTTQTYKDIGVTGIDAGNIASINDALKGLPGANKDTAAEVQGIVDAYRKVLGVADAVAGNTDAANLPSLADYGKIGVSEVTTVTQAALLGSVIDGKNKVDADTVSEIKALALASNAVLEAAASANGASLSMAQLEQLGIKGVTADNLAAVRQAIANSADDGSAINSLSKLQSVVSATTTQVASVLTGLQSYSGANGQSAPTTQTYKDLAVTGVDADNIASINDALKGLPGANKDTAAEVQGIVDAYRKVLAVADAVAGNTDAANLPSLADYGKIGVSEVTTVTQAALLGSVIDGKNKVDADTVSEIKALALASNAVLEAAASANGASLSMAQLEQLGIKGVTADNLAAVRQAIANSADDGSAINSLSKLQSVVSATTTQVASVLTGLQGYSGANGQSAPTTQTYKDIGVTGVDADNIASINDALKGLPGANKDTAAEVQGIVDAYRKVLGVADAVAGNTDAANLPSLADYGKIGVSEVTTVTQAALLGSVIDGKNKVDADTVSEIKALALASNAVLEAAASANGASLSMAQLEQLGIKGVTADNLAAVRQAIADSADDGSAINSLSKLQSVVSATTTQVASVLTGLQSYSGANGQSAPTTQTYKDLAVTGVDAGNIASINDALKGLPGANKDTAAEVQGIVDAYRKVLAVADAVAGNTDAANLPSLADYGKIGVSEVTTVTQAALLGSVIDAKNLAAVDSVAELRALADAAQAVLTAAALPAGGTSTLSKAQLELLGIKDVTDNNLAVVRQAIANSADDGSAINSLSKLQTLVSGAAFSASDVQLSNDTGSFSTDYVTTVNNQTISAKLSTVISAGDTLEGSVNSGATWEKINSMVTDRAITWTGVTLNSGVNNIVFRLTKQDGSQYLSSAQTYTLDNTAPAAPTLVLDAASDTGSSNSDRITNDATPTISGTAEAGSSVKLYDGSTQVGSATTGGDGKWSITPGSALANGTHTLTVKATDAAGNVSDSSADLSVVVDTERPTAVALSKTIIATLAATTGATVGSLSASDTQAISYTLAAGGEHNSQFEIVGADLKVKDGAGLSAGTYNINVKATDAAGNEALQALSFEVVNAPSVSSIVRADNASETVAKGATQLSYTVNFSEAVTGVDVADFVLTTTGSAAASIVSVSAGATNAGYIVVINGISGDGTVRLDVKASGTGIKNLKGIELVGGYSSAQTYTLDNTAPAAPTLVLDAASDTGISNSDRITNADTPTISGTAEAGSRVELYDGSIVVAEVQAGGDGKWSTTPGSALVNGTHTLTVKATDAAGNVSDSSADLSVVVDTAAPTVSSVAITSSTGIQNSTLNAGDVVTVTMGLSQAVTVTGTPQLGLNIGGTTVQANYASGSGTNSLTFTYTILAGQTDADGISIATDSLALNGGTIVDAAGNSATLGHTSVANNAGYLVDTTAPTVSSVAITSSTGIQNSTLNAGDVVTVTMGLSEAVTVTGTPQLGLNIGGTTVQANYASGSGTNSLTFTYTILAGQTDADGISIAADSLALNGGTILDAAGNSATLGHTSVANNAGYLVDTTAPTVSSVAITSSTGIQNSTLNAGDVVTVTMGLSEAVTVTGTPQLGLNIGGTTVQANYASGSGTNSLTFTYTILAGQTDADGISIAADSLALNGGTILDAAGNSATLGHTSVANNAGYLVDTTAPIASVTTATLSNKSSAVVQSSEAGTAYLVNTSVSVSGLSSITGAADNLWNSVSIAAAASNTNLAAAGLSDGSYKLYTVDSAGNLSVASSNAVKIDTTAPTVSSVAITSSTGIQNSTLNAGDVVTVTMGLSEAVTVTGTPQLGLNIGGTTVQANYASGSGTNSLTFTYTILAGQTDADGISIAADSLALNGGTILDAAGNSATLGHTSVANNAGYLVDTTAPIASVTTATLSNKSSAVVQSSEAGTAYLVNTSVSVSGLSSITGAADNLWNSVSIAAAASNTNLAAAGLSDGSYKLYTVDSAGNLSVASSNTVTITMPKAGDPLIDLGIYGKLIRELGGRNYYYWDRSGDGAAGNDNISMDWIEQTFFGSSAGAVISDSNSMFNIDGLNVQMISSSTLNNLRLSAGMPRVAGMWDYSQYLSSTVGLNYNTHNIVGYYGVDYAPDDYKEGVVFLQVL